MYNVNQGGFVLTLNIKGENFKPFNMGSLQFVRTLKPLFITSETPFYYSEKFGEEIGEDILFSNETLART